MHRSRVQKLKSLQRELRGEPLQVPEVHASDVVQENPSLHVVPFGLAVNTQPLVALQVSVVHVFESLQFELTGVPRHVVPLHTSDVVQAIPSVHGVPGAAAGCTHPEDVH
jgi:hypothetical protein